MIKPNCTENIKTTILANEGFFNAKIVQENPGKPVRIISVRTLSDIPFIYVADIKTSSMDS